MTSASFQNCADSVQKLLLAVTALHQRCTDGTISPIHSQEWYEILFRKLVPQLSDQSFLVVAVVGGTNIGKSVVFNHLAGFRASATSPLASGTRHPTCLVPVGFRERHDLQQVFPGFVLHNWTGPDEALIEHGEHWLFVREADQIPPNLVILDTPDIDSDARINWERADHIRLSADVLVAVLTQQKYNDAAVKEFFRKAASEEKSIILVLNQCLLPEDEAFWPLWVDTFCRETGVQPQIVYVAPNNRRAAEANQLPFYEREWRAAPATPGGSSSDAEQPVASAVESPSPSRVDETPRNLMHDLASLRFGEIKLRALAGSLRELVNVDRGLPRWLQEIRERSAQYQKAAELLTANKFAEVANWPAISGRLLADEIRLWWGQQRSGWASTVHGTYSMLSQTVLTPLRLLRDRWSGTRPLPIQTYREREWLAILQTIELVYEKLEWLSNLGNDLLQPKLSALLSGVSRAKLIQNIRQAHDEVDLEEQLRNLIRDQMDTFTRENPDAFGLLRRLDSVTAALRPAISIALALTGVGLAGDVIFTSAATTTIGHLTVDMVGGAVTASVGDTLIGEGVSQGASLLQIQLQQLSERFAASRASWLAGLMQKHLLGTLPEELQHASGMSNSPEFQATSQALELVCRSVQTLGQSRDISFEPYSYPVR